MKNPLEIWRGSRTFDPMRELGALQRNIDRMFDDIFNVSSISMPTIGSSWSPSCDVEEAADRYLMTFDLPGVRKEDIKIELSENQLTISGERKLERKEGRRMQERFHGTFMRSFTLPAHVDPNKIKADYSEGVLCLEVPKVQAVQPKQIPISSGAQKSITEKGGKVA